VKLIWAEIGKIKMSLKCEIMMGQNCQINIVKLKCQSNMGKMSNNSR